ncbi:NAD(P)-dependent oxidoreductase [Rhizobacter sp. Root404]|uniref:NAD(P)-dependent oxidoreductase n=1 Tax=Rhizobacter sp. Root404 TaxID=1736528 RepID=UPI0006F33AE1|nr:NAD(P)-dependent oxidoreductase [Rhizobacter sp. Root404]KQW38526.1 2-hydroxy-3-oxopropionate reductase [Rhizobacter sp. Root404]
MSAPLSVGFVGTGIMGGHMARRLAAAGHRVKAWNRTPEKAQALSDCGVVVATRAMDVAREADVVLCMLSSGPVCDDVLLGSGSVLAAMRPRSILIVMSSIPVESARHQSREAAARGVDYLDAPVSGGEVGAEGGKLAIMVGGEESAFERSRAVFETMGRPVRVGPVGSGQLSKLVNQMMVASSISSVAEALLFAERGGADPAKVREALLGGFADSTVLRQHGQRMIDGNFVPGGPAKYQVKDTSTALALARSIGLELPILGLVDRLFTDMVAHGDGDLDHSAILLELRRRQPSRHRQS